MATPVASSTAKPVATIVIASLMLFSMFFGAGNLIFPPMVGVSAGTNFWPAVLGFLAAGVLLPVLAIVAVSISGRSVRDLSSNGGALFGLVFSVMAYLATAPSTPCRAPAPFPWKPPSPRCWAGREPWPMASSMWSFSLSP